MLNVSSVYREGMKEAPRGQARDPGKRDESEERLRGLRLHAAFRRPAEGGREGRRWPTGHPALDEALGGGLPGGGLVEVFGERSSGRTSFLLGCVAAATRRRELVAWIDGSNALDPESAALAGVVLSRFIWLRPGESGGEDRVFRAAEILMTGGAVQVVVLDLAGRSRFRADAARWFRLQRALRGRELVGVVMGQGGQGVGGAVRLRCFAARERGGSEGVGTAPE